LIEEALKTVERYDPRVYHDEQHSLLANNHEDQMEPIFMDAEYLKLIHDKSKHQHFYDPDFVKWDPQELTQEQVDKDFADI